MIRAKITPQQAKAILMQLEYAEMVQGKGMAEYLCFMAARIVEMHRVLGGDPNRE